MAEDRVRSWVPGYSDTGLSVTLHPGTEDVLESCVTALAQGLSMADPEADPGSQDRRLARALLVLGELLSLLDVQEGRSCREVPAGELDRLFLERGWTGAGAETGVEELARLLVRSVKELIAKNFDTAVDIMIQLEDKANKYYNTIKSYSQRVIFTRFILFSFLFRVCYSEEKSEFCPVAGLSNKEKDDIQSFLKAKVKNLFVSVKRKSTFFSSSIKMKHQDSMDDTLRLIYPIYSVSRSWSSPFHLLRDEGAEQHLELHINPEFLPSSEEKPVMLQLGVVLVQEEDLVPLHVFLWRDEKHLFLRRQEKVWRFVVTHGGPNSILHIQLSRDRIKSKNTLHPTLVSSELPKKLLSTEKLLKDITSLLPNVAVYREMAVVGPVQLQSLGVEVNCQNSLGQSLLHLAVSGGRQEVVESLLEAGAHRHLRDSSGLHALAVAVLEAGAMESEEAAERLVRSLARGDTNLDLPDHSGRTALHHASTLSRSCHI